MENDVRKKPRIYILLWLACLGGIVALGCRELEDLLTAEFPAYKTLIRVGVLALFSLSLVQVAIRPFFEEIGKKLK